MKILTVKFIPCLGTQVSNDRIRRCKVSFASFEEWKCWDGRQGSEIRECLPRYIHNREAECRDNAFNFTISVLDGNIGAVV